MARQRTLEEQEERNRQRGRRLQDRRDVRYGSIYRRMMLWAIDDRIGSARDSWTMTFVELARDCEMSRRQAYRTAMELQEMGLIDIQETQTNSGKYEFQILWDKISKLAETTVQELKKTRGRPEKVVPDRHELKKKVVPDRHELNEKVVPDRQKLCLTDKSCDSQTIAPLISAPKRTNSAPKKAGSDPLEEIPPGLRSPEFLAAWSDWCVYRTSKRKPVTPLAAKRQLAALDKVGLQAALAAIDEAIRNDWQGLFPKPISERGNSNGKPSIEQRQISALQRAIAKAEQEERSAQGAPPAGQGVPRLPGG